jgi:hypothetical protein
MIDRDSRARGVQLLRRFRDGAITLDELDNQWPDRSRDSAIPAIGEMLWRLFQTDFKPVTLGRPGLDSQEHVALVDRCALFLESSAEYRWPIELPGSSLVGALQQALTLGVWDGVTRREWATYAGAGMIQVWPFLSEEDYHAAAGRGG